MINFTLTPEDLSYVTESGTLKSYEGKIKISVGGFQPDEKNQSKNNIITQTLEIEK
ncbi:hypothetical protein D3C87_1865200 [compost metagenome]